MSLSRGPCYSNFSVKYTTGPLSFVIAFYPGWFHNKWKNVLESYPLWDTVLLNNYTFSTLLKKSLVIARRLGCTFWDVKHLTSGFDWYHQRSKWIILLLVGQAIWITLPEQKKIIRQYFSWSSYHLMPNIWHIIFLF